MHTLSNLPVNDSTLIAALEKLNEACQKDPELAHYVLQWTVLNCPPQLLKSLVKCVQVPN